MGTQQLQISIHDEASFKRVGLHGVIDTSNVDEFKKTMDGLVHAPEARLVLDCTELSYINSTSFGLLVQYHRTCESNNGRFVIFGLSKKLQNIMRILGLEGVLNIYHSSDDALASVS